MTMSEALERPQIFSVSHLTNLVRQSLEGRFKNIDVEGEISGWKVYPSGHAYFTLKDESAQISAVMFSSALEAAVSAEPVLLEKLCNGAKVKVRGSISVYPPRGQYQFVVRRIKLAGVGELMLKFLELKARLQAEGLFDESRKRKLPFLPHRIGIVTSEAGAVIHDMQRVFSRRFPGVELKLYPALVQGSEAPRTLIEGLNYFNRNQWADVVVIARGGGSFEDLFCFNDEALVRAVASSDLPVVSAVGHETDFTLCDFAADKRAGTPSIAAELLVPVRTELMAKVEDLKMRMVMVLRSKGENFAQRVDYVSEALARSLERYHERSRNLLQGLERSLSLLSPYGVLDRGYSLVTHRTTGRVVKSSAEISPGEVLDIRFAQGSSAVEVRED